MIGKLIGVVAFIILAVFIVSTYISGDTNTLKSESTRIGNQMITEMKTIEE